MSRTARSLVLFVVVFHLTAFLVEAFLWMHPAVHEPVLKPLAGTVAVDIHDQALVLKTLFVNQGFYNLFLALAGIAGLVFLGRNDVPVGKTLITYMCLTAVGAGVVLAASTGAYVGAFLQAGPAALALLAMWRSTSSTSQAPVG